MRARAKPDQRDALLTHFSQYEQRRQPNGFESAMLGWGDKDPARAVVFVRFRDRSPSASAPRWRFAQAFAQSTNWMSVHSGWLLEVLQKVRY